MSLKLGTQDIAGISQNTKYNAHHLLDFKWTDCIMNDVSWLRADTFSWQSGNVYVSAYNHLVADLQGITAEIETIGSYTVTFYRATDGHKICMDDQETTVANIYSETGIAWYYILDTTSTQFKLPRTKYGFEGLRTNVGDNINESLPNITGEFNTGDRRTNTGANGAVYRTTTSNSQYFAGQYTGASTNQSFGFDASLSSPTYQNNAPVQERATQMYLYFYVGDYSQTAVEQTAGLNASLFNGKADVDLTNIANAGYIKMAGASMPSYSYNDLTLGASGTTYTAPANGWVFLAKQSTSANDSITISSKTSNNSTLCRARCLSPAAGNSLEALLPVFKNQIFAVEYSAGGSVTWFRFIYAVGSESEA